MDKLACTCRTFHQTVAISRPLLYSSFNLCMPVFAILRRDAVVAHFSPGLSMDRKTQFAHLCVSAMISRRMARSISSSLKVKEAVREITTSRKALSDEDDEERDRRASSAQHMEVDALGAIKTKRQRVWETNQRMSNAHNFYAEIKQRWELVGNSSM